MDFMETFHKDLYRYALYHVWGDKERAHDLLFDTYIYLLKGSTNIDFSRAPRKYFNVMMGKMKQRGRKKQKDFENDLIGLGCDSHNSDEQTHAYEANQRGQYEYDEWQRVEREKNLLAEIGMQFEQLLCNLTPTERMHLEWSLDGLSYEEMQNKHPVSKTRIGQILTRVRKKLKKQMEQARTRAGLEDE